MRHGRDFDAGEAAARANHRESAMSSHTKLGLYLVALVAVFAAAYGAGRLVGPLEQPSAEHPAVHASHGGR